MKSRRPAWVLGLIAIVLLVSGTVVILASQNNCLGLTMWSSDEKVTQLQKIADSYQRSGRNTDGSCVRVTVTISSSRATADLLAADAATPWDEKSKPDIWSPSSSVWVERLRSGIVGRTAKIRSLPAELTYLAASPVLIAMPRPMAEALGWPEATIGWRELTELARNPNGWASKGHPEWGSFKLGKTNPAESTTGLLSTTATATALADAGDVLTTADLTRVAADLRVLESAAVHYGRYVETFVGNLYEADSEGKALDYVSAIAMEEKVVLDYNKGILLGNPPRTVTPPKVPLAAIFPSDGTMLSDNPALVLDADWVPENKRRAAEDFLRFVKENAQVFKDAGFRDSEGKPGDIHSPANGTVKNPVYRLVRTPPTAVVEAVREVWRQNRRRANILMIIDVSGSMKDQVPEAQRSRLTLAQNAAKVIPGQLAADDRLALWEFSGIRGSSPLPYRELVPAGPIGQVQERYLDSLTKLTAEGPTALYTTTRAAVEKLTADYDPARINAVVILSDGENQYPEDDDLDGLIRDLKATSPDKPVRVFTIAYGSQADADELAKISAATRAHSFDAKDATTIDGVMLEVLSNF